MKIKFSNPIVILANGEFPKHNIPLKVLEEAKTIICCDGASEKLIENGNTPSYVVGDLDSTSQATLDKLADKIIKISQQTDNDLNKAICWTIDNGAKDISILGATGNREDHTLGNLSLILNLKFTGNVKILTDFGMFTLVTKQHTFESYVGQQVSIFAENPIIEITTTNLKYPLNDTRLNHIFSGTLNESTDTQFSVQISQGKILVYQAFEETI